MNLKEKVDGICNRGDFIGFVNALRNDLKIHPEEWENSTLDNYFEALSAWIEDMDGYYKNQGLSVPKSPSWKNFAEMLLASKYYE